MKIDDIITNKENRYLYMERYVNNGSPSGFDRVHTSSGATSPREGAASFSLPIIEFDNSIVVDSIGDDPLLLGSNCMYCHPDNLNNSILYYIKDKWKVVDEIQVSPTASARTVKWVGHDYFIKLDYMGFLGRITRNLDYQHVLSANEVTRDLMFGVDSKLYNSEFGLLTENKGRVAYIPVNNGATYEFGYILRDFNPYSQLSKENLYLIPAFSLFGVDVNHSKDKPLILQLFEKSNLDINEFAYEKVFKPLVNCYFDPLVNHGLAMESHAQNTLIAIDDKYDIRLIVSRDLESVDKDIPLREYLKVNSIIESTGYKCIRKEDYNYTIKHSFMFDFKFGEYLMSPLIDVFSQIKSFNKDEIISRIKELSSSFIAVLPQGYFPDTWYTYDNVQFVPGEKRPYISHSNPKYR